MSLLNVVRPRSRRLPAVGRWVAIGLISAIITAAAVLSALLIPVEPAAAQANDATLSGITVDGASVAGFASDRLSYQFGVAHDTSQVTIAATPTGSGADVSYIDDDADPVAAGFQVDLRAGQNPVIVRVVSADNINTMDYTLFVNRGVVTSYGWKASDDLDVLIGAGNAMPFGIWSDKRYFWVSDVEDGKLYAYDKLTQERIPASDIDLDSDNADHTGIWSNRTTMWVADSADRKLYAYNLSSNTRVSSEDFNTLIAAGNEAPGGIWSDGETMWVVDAADTKIYAYNVGTKARDSDKDFDLHSDNANPSGIWSDRETMWVSDTTDHKIYAYSFSDGMRDSAKDFNTLALAGNETPNGIWSDSLTMWVADTANGKAYSYNMLRTNNATLSSITVDGNSVEGFAAGRDTYNVGVAHDTTQVTIAATTTESTSTMAFSTIDADDTAPGHQVDLDAGRNGVNITVTAVNGITTMTYTVFVNRGVQDDYGWKAVDDFDTLIGAGNTDPYGAWSNGTTLWISDSEDGKLYAYNLSTGARDAARDIDLHASNDAPSDIWSNGTTIWVADTADAKLFAYSLSGGVRQDGAGGTTNREFDLDAGNQNPSGLWSDGTTVWVANNGMDAGDKVFAYDLATGTRRAAQDFDTLDAAGNHQPAGMWSDGVTMWVADFSSQVLAYAMSDKQLDSTNLFDTFFAAVVVDPAGIWSDGETLWVVDSGTDTVFSFNMPKSDVATLSSLTVSPKDIHGFDPATGTYEVGVAHDVTQATVNYAITHSAATAAVSPADADTAAAGHQVNLSAGRNEVAITVTAQDTSTTMAYTVSVNRGVNTLYGWKAVDDFDTLAAEEIANPKGISGNGATMWVVDAQGGETYAFNSSSTLRDADKDFTLHTDNSDANGAWSNETTLWVADHVDDKLYAYTLGPVHTKVMHR